MESEDASDTVGRTSGAMPAPMAQPPDLRHTAHIIAAQAAVEADAAETEAREALKHASATAELARGLVERAEEAVDLARVLRAIARAAAEAAKAKEGA